MPAQECACTSVFGPPCWLSSGSVLQSVIGNPRSAVTSSDSRFSAWLGFSSCTVALLDLRLVAPRHNCGGLRGSSQRHLRSSWIDREVCCGTTVGIGEVADRGAGRAGVAESRDRQGDRPCASHGLDLYPRAAQTTSGGTETFGAGLVGGGVGGDL